MGTCLETEDKGRREEEVSFNVFYIVPDAHNEGKHYMS